MKTLTVFLTSDAFVSQNCYEANGYYVLDGEKIPVTVYWDLIEYDNNEDVLEDMACNWESPAGVKDNGQWIADGFSGVNKFAGFSVEYIDCQGKKI